jgi:CheY-like chemotaxis protein
VRLYCDRTPDVIVADIGLPGMDGFELLRQVRAQPLAGPVVPAVAVTAYARSDDQARVLAAGFQGHVAKPIDPDALLAVLGSILQEHA